MYAVPRARARSRASRGVPYDVETRTVGRRGPCTRSRARVGVAATSRARGSDARGGFASSSRVARASFTRVASRSRESSRASERESGREIGARPGWHFFESILNPSRMISGAVVRAVAVEARWRTRGCDGTSRRSVRARGSIGRRAVEGEGTAAGAFAFAPREVTDAIRVPEELVQVRAYVRWEEAGMPSDTTEEWRRKEYDEALLDLKIELLRGKTMNEIRARYKMPPVEGGDARMFTEDPDLARRVKAAEAMAVSEKRKAAADETATLEFIESVVAEEATDAVAEDAAVEEDVVVAAAATVVDDVEDAVDDGYDVDVFAAMTEEELADMESSLNDATNWSTREQLVAAIKGLSSDVANNGDSKLIEDLREAKSEIMAKEDALQQLKIELENVEAEIVVVQATMDKALAEMKESWAAEVSALKAELNVANARANGTDEDASQRIESLLKEAEESEEKRRALEADVAAATRKLEESKIAQIKAEAVRDANAEVILMLKKELESTKDELRALKSNSVSTSEHQALKKELDRAWEAAAELQSMWDNDRKVIDFLTKSMEDEKAKKAARDATSIPVAAIGLLNWARNSIKERAADVGAVSQQTLETVTQVYQELEASTGEFSDDVIVDDSESDLLHM